MARTKSRLTQAKRAREIARRQKRARKADKREARKLAAGEPAPGRATTNGDNSVLSSGVESA